MNLLSRESDIVHEEVVEMEMNSAKALDEVCNYFNEAYRDEVLYSGRSDSSQSVSTRSGGASKKTGVAGFSSQSSRLYTRNE